VDEVRRLRLEKGWSQNELAYHAKLAPSVISLIETGKRDPNATTLRKLAGALEVRIPDLFEGRDSRKAQRRSSPEPRLFNSLDERRLSRFSEAIIAAAARWGEAMSSPDMNDTKRFGLIDAALDLSRVIEERAEEEDWEALPNQERLEIVTTMEKLIEAANQGLRHLEESGRAKAQEVLVNQRREQMREWTRRISA
jgi:transcriptional regulator with XRE-family HTH domain